MDVFKYYFPAILIASADWHLLLKSSSLFHTDVEVIKLSFGSICYIYFKMNNSIAQHLFMALTIA